MAITVKKYCKSCGKEMSWAQETVHTCTEGVVTVRDGLCPRCLEVQESSKDN